MAYIVKTGGNEEVLVFVISSSGPEVSNLLGLDVLHLKGRAIKRRSGNLKDRQRRDEVIEWLSHTRDGRDQRREADLPLVNLGWRSSSE